MRVLLTPLRSTVVVATSNKHQTTVAGVLRHHAFRSVVLLATSDPDRTAHRFDCPIYSYVLRDAGRVTNGPIFRSELSPLEPGSNLLRSPVLRAKRNSPTPPGHIDLLHEMIGEPSGHPSSRWWRAKAAFRSDRRTSKLASVANTARILPQRQLAEVGQTDADWRSSQLQAVKETSADSSRLTEVGKRERLRKAITEVPKTRGAPFDISYTSRMDRL